MDNIQLSYSYYFLEPLHVKPVDEWDSEEEEEDRRRRPSNVPNKLAMYVFVDRKPNKFVFEITLPAAGKYLFDVYGELRDERDEKVDKHKHRDKGKAKGKHKDDQDDDHDDTDSHGEKNGHNKAERDDDDTKSVDSSEDQRDTKIQKLCQFRLIAEQDPDPEEIETNPDNPEIGWGPGPQCRELGLVPVSHHKGSIYTKPDQEIEVKFEMTRKVEVMTQLLHDHVPIYELVEMVSKR